MRILAATSAFKGSYSANLLAQSIERACLRVSPDFQVTRLPIADGGDGSLESLHTALGGKIHHLDVFGALGELHRSQWLEIDGLAVVELATACGLGLLDRDSLDSLKSSTYGLGQVIAQVYSRNLQKLAVCIGGSASTDGGSGMLAALGARFFDRQNNQLSLGGGALSELCYLDLSAVKRLKAGKPNMSVLAICDVENPLLGDNGAANIFAPQKGASTADIEILERGLTIYADLLEKECGDVARNLKGAGAAGGTAFGLSLALGASIVSGFAWLSNLLDLHSRVKEHDLIVTTEGRFDSQSLQGKASGQLIRLSAEMNKPLWIVSACKADEDNQLKDMLSQYPAVKVQYLKLGAGEKASLEDVEAIVAGLLATCG